jgi:excisionase family DNA binding protein
MLGPRLSTPDRTEEWGFTPLRDRAGMSLEPTRQPINDPERTLLDAAEVAALLGVPTSWVYAEARAGRLPHVRIGRYRRFRRRTVDAWIDAHERGPVR